MSHSHDDVIVIRLQGHSSSFFKVIQVQVCLHNVTLFVQGPFFVCSPVKSDRYLSKTWQCARARLVAQLPITTFVFLYIEGNRVQN